MQVELQQHQHPLSSPRLDSPTVCPAALGPPSSPCPSLEPRHAPPALAKGAGHRPGLPISPQLIFPPFPGTIGDSRRSVLHRAPNSLTFSSSQLFAALSSSHLQQNSAETSNPTAAPGPSSQCITGFLPQLAAGNGHRQGTA